MRVLAGLIVCAVLAGCSGFGGSGSKSLVVTDRGIVLSAPNGFCADLASSSLEASEAFVVYGNCAALAGATDAPAPNITSVVTVGVIAGASGGASDISEYFASDAGKALLSRQAVADDVEITDTFLRNDAVFLRVRDTGPGLLAGISDTYWRGYVPTPDAMFAITVLDFTGAPISSADGLQILSRFAARVPRSTAQTADSRRGIFGRTGVLGGLLN